MSAISSLGPSRADHFDLTTVVGPTLPETPASVHFGLSVLERFHNGWIADARHSVETGQEMMDRLQTDDIGLYQEIQEWMHP